jgi:hypothetical protein
MIISHVRYIKKILIYSRQSNVNAVFMRLYLAILTQLVGMDIFIEFCDYGSLFDLSQIKFFTIDEIRSYMIQLT